MNVTTLFQQVNAAYRGSDDDAPTTGTDFLLWMATANRKQSEWARDSKQNWRSTFRTDALTPVLTAGQQTYTLPTDFLNAANTVVITLNGQTQEYMIAHPQERGQFENACYINGNQLTFFDPVTTDSAMLGGTITVDAYHTLPELVDGTSTVGVDDPYWLAYAVAAELAFNDITYSDKTGDINAKANSLYGIMVTNNRRGTYNTPRRTPTNVQRIVDTRHETSYGASEN